MHAPTNGSLPPASPSVPHSLDSDIITLNVSGRKFVIARANLTLYPSTLLGSPALQHFFRPDHHEYFIDRNRDVFESIFDFYMSGKLYPPHGIPEEMYQEEVKFYQMMTLFASNTPGEEHRESGEAGGTRWGRMCRSVQHALDNPNRSVPGKIWGWLDILFILISVVSMMVETNPSVGTRIEKEGSVEHRVASRVEMLTVMFFTADVMLRLCVAKSKCGFLMSPATWLDIITVVPYYLELFFDASRFKILRVRLISSINFKNYNSDTK